MMVWPLSYKIKRAECPMRLLADAQFLGDSCGESFLVQYDVHRLAGYEVARNVPDAFVLTGLTP